MKKQKFLLKNLDCAGCAAKIEDALKKHPKIGAVSLNFASTTLHIEGETISEEELSREIVRVDPQVEIIRTGTEKIEAPQLEIKREIVVMGITATLLAVLFIYGKQLRATPFGIAEYAIAIAGYVLSGWGVIKGALATIRRGQWFDEHVLMLIATIGAVGIHALEEAVGVMLFYHIGRFFQNLALFRSRRSIQSLLEIKPEFAIRKTPNGTERVHPESVLPGDCIIVKPGESVPLDGDVISGNSTVNTAALTGESVPRSVKEGDKILAGVINLSGTLHILVTRLFSDSSIARILDLVENAFSRKAKTEQFMTLFARYYTPFVVACATVIAVLPPVISSTELFSVWFYRALVLLVISCPCALVVSIPLGYFGGIGAASRHGILVKGSNVLDALAHVKSVVFDKTGTLTKGIFQVTSFSTAPDVTEQELLRLVAATESHSNHPIALSILEEAKKRQVTFDTSNITIHQEYAGMGCTALVNGRRVVVGNAALLRREGVKHPTMNGGSTAVYVAVDGCYAGAFSIGDRVKEDAFDAVKKLRDTGVNRISMLTGDNAEVASHVAKTLKLDYYKAELLPEEKVTEFEKISGSGKKREKSAFVGDGINDAPVIAVADVGVSMGELGSDAAIETADVVLMTDHPSRLSTAIRIAKKTRTIVFQNIIMALGIKLAFLSLGSVGLASIWEAVFADIGVALMAILNATRALRVKG